MFIIFCLFLIRFWIVLVWGILGIQELDGCRWDSAVGDLSVLEASQVSVHSASPRWQEKAMQDTILDHVQSSAIMECPSSANKPRLCQSKQIHWALQ